MNININGLKTHFFHIENDKNQTIENNKNSQIKTKIISYCFYSINEVYISNKIKKIPYYSNYYSILKEYDFINISTFREKVLEKVQLLDENKKYLLFTYNKHFLTFNNFLTDFEEPKMLIFYIISSLSYLLQSLVQLENQMIVFFQLSPQNIVFLESCREKPLLHNFQLSLQVSKLNEDYITNIIKKTSDYSLKPLEVHVLFYLIENSINTMSYSFIEEIVEVFIKNLSVLSFFSQGYRENYQKSCINYLKKYINKPKNEIILDILTNYDKWDIYSISLLYLNIFATISKTFSLKDTFINKISLELSKNIHPDPSKRENLDELVENYEKLLNCDCSFVNSLEPAKMSELWNS
jgi:hypothetical protein